MIAVLCAMNEERDALIRLMKDVKAVKGKKLKYRDGNLNNEYYVGKLGNKDVVVSRCGIGQLFATISAVTMIEKYKPELIINLGCAGSLKSNIRVGDVIVADRIAQWRFEVPGWERNIDATYCSYPCDEKVLKIFSKIKTEENVYTGNIVSADEFIYKKGQIRIIDKYFPDALCGEMEGCAVAAAAYAYDVPCAVIRSISDETLVAGSFKEFEFNLDKVCNNAAKLCKEIIKRY